MKTLFLFPDATDHGESTCTTPETAAEVADEAIDYSKMPLLLDLYSGIYICVN